MTVVTLGEGVDAEQVHELAGDVSGWDTLEILNSDGELVEQWEGEASAHLGVILGEGWEQAVAFWEEAWKNETLRKHKNQWLRAGLKLAKEQVKAEELVEMASRLNTSIRTLAKAFAGGMSLDELRRSEEEGVGLDLLLAGREAGIGLDELAKGLRMGLEIQALLDGARNGMSLEASLKVQNHHLYKQNYYSGVGVFALAATGVDLDELSELVTTRPGHQLLPFLKAGFDGKDTGVLYDAVLGVTTRRSVTRRNLGAYALAAEQAKACGKDNYLKLLAGGLTPLLSKP